MVTDQLPAGSSRVTFDAAPFALPDQWPPIWFSLAEHDWRSLVLVPSQRTASAASSARALGAVGDAYEERSVRVIEAERATPESVREVIRLLAERNSAGERTIVVVSSPMLDVSAIPIARAVDAAVLVVPLGTTTLRDARRVLQLIGRDRFIGSIATRTS